MRILLTALFMTLATQAAADWTNYLPNFLKSAETVFVENCELIFKDRLKAPSTYQRLEYFFDEKPATPIESIYYDQKANADEMNRFKSANEDLEQLKSSIESDEQYFKNKYGDLWKNVMKSKLAMINLEFRYYTSCLADNECPTRATALVKYQAANSFGTPLANVFKCSVNYSEDLKGKSDRSIYVDGFTKTDWITESLKR